MFSLGLALVEPNVLVAVSALLRLVGLPRLSHPGRVRALLAAVGQVQVVDSALVEVEGEDHVADGRGGPSDARSGRDAIDFCPS